MTDCEDGLEIKVFEEKGRGVIATQFFHRGDFVVEYKGELLDRQTAKMRENGYSADSKIGCYMYYFNFNNESYW